MQVKHGRISVFESSQRVIPDDEIVTWIVGQILRFDLIYLKKNFQKLSRNFNETFLEKQL